MIKNKMQFLMGIGVLSGLLNACTTVDLKAMIEQGNAVSTTNKKLAAIDKEKVKVFFSKTDLPKKYEVIGRVAVDNYNFVGFYYAQETITNELKKHAASIGANGIININPGVAQTFGDAVLLS